MSGFFCVWLIQEVSSNPSTFYAENDDIQTEGSEMILPKVFLANNQQSVDKVDEIKCTYSVVRITWRWTLVTFFSFLNIAGINEIWTYERIISSYKI